VNTTTALALTAGDLQAFQKLKIPAALLEEAGIRRVTALEARDEYGIHYRGNLDGIVFPYHAPSGDRVNARLRRDHPEVENGKLKNKYISAQYDHRRFYYPPNCCALLTDASVPIVLVEAEKSVLALWALSARTGRPLLPVGIGGCWGWRGRIGKTVASDGTRVDELGALTDFDIIKWTGRTSIVCLDSNVATNASVQAAESALRRELRQRGADVRTARIPNVPAINGPDDFIGRHEDEEFLRLLGTDNSDDHEAHAKAKVPIRNWPAPIDKYAYHGIAGEIVKKIEPESEADPVAILIQFLIGFGNLVGRHAFFQVEADRHYTNEYAVLTGPSSVARKGTSSGQAFRTLQWIDADWDKRCRKPASLSSGEGLLWALRDEIRSTEAIKEKGRTVDYQEVISDPGVTDKRLLTVESEFASLLRMVNRDGNSLSGNVRLAWDGGNLSSMVKKSPVTVTDGHVSIVGHATVEEVLRYLDRTEIANGFANRFLWFCVRRSKMLPMGGGLTDEDLQAFIPRLNAAVEFSRSERRVLFDAPTRLVWERVYPFLTEERAGMFGAITSRAAPHVLRLALIYSLLDLSEHIREEHLKAALAVWRYAEDSVRFIFGDVIGDPTADAILTALKDKPAGLTRTEISEVFHRNKTAEQIEAALRVLATQGRIRCEFVETQGRTAERWLSVGLNSSNSFNSFREA
jgi:hypothetical protein